MAHAGQCRFARLLKNTLGNDASKENSVTFAFDAP